MKNKSLETKFMLTTSFVLVIAIHVVSYYRQEFGLDQLIPCIIGYSSIWAILMSVTND